jgi:hypothetical protein
MSSTSTPVYQDKDTVYSFSVYEYGILAYSKYTFNFDAYLLDYADKMLPNPTKSTIFYHFLINNDTDLNNPYSVKDDLKKYFNPMNNDVVNYNEKYGYSFSLNYMQSVNPPGEVNSGTVFEHQFELIEYSDDELRRLQDYIYYNDFLIYYTKYNFDFDTYRNDWNVHSYNKLLAFTDFALRTQYLNHTIIGAYGYGDPTDNFKKYFIQSNGIQDFLLKYSVTSIYTKVYNSFPNIDWENYKRLNPDIPFDNVDGLQEYYIREGQFEQRPVTFIQAINNNIYEKTQSIVTVEGDGTGFLYNGSSYNIVGGKKMVYLVTCYHIIADSKNKNVINASVNYYIENSNEQISKTLAFKIIGYDLFYDILVALYDPSLDYNKEFNTNLDLDTIPTLNIDGTSFLEKNSNVYTIANIGKIDSNVLIEGKLMNNSYRGSYNSTFFLGLPESFLINFYTQGGSSGAPLFQENNDNCIGMIIGSTGNKNQYTIALSNFYLSCLAFNAIEKWYTFLKVFPVYNIKTLDYFIKDMFSKKWLGTLCRYYNNNLSSIWSQFNNFNYDSGLVIVDFIIGFNKNTKNFITNSLELDQYNVVPLNTPLLNTKIYERFINNGRVPIVIKSILTFENVESDYDYFNFGLKSGQQGYYTFTFNLTQIESVLNNKKYTNVVKRLFPQILINYYYYNGNIWIEDSEIVGGNTPNWYNEYLAEDGRLIYLHKFEYPLTLLYLLNPYIYSIGKANNI